MFYYVPEKRFYSSCYVELEAEGKLIPIARVCGGVKFGLKAVWQMDSTLEIYKNMGERSCHLM